MKQKQPPLIEPPIIEPPNSDGLSEGVAEQVRPRLSIIIPVLNEAPSIESSLLRLQALREEGVEIIVVDGGSADASLEISRRYADKVKLSGKGRAHQMNCGAQHALGDVLLFLHADTELPNELPIELGDLAAMLETRNLVWGRFDVRLSGHQFAFRVIEFMMNHRSRFTGIATGDQGLFISRKVFNDLGGYKEMPLMEDIELCQRLKKLSAPLCLNYRVITSSRKWEREGVLNVVLLMWRLRLGYFFGVPVEKLAKHYY